MNLLHFLLNLLGLALWCCWRPAGLEAARFPPGVGAPTRGRRTPWIFLAALVLLLPVRGWLYTQVGRDLDWVAALDLGAVRLDFHSARLGRMMAFSGAGWLVFFGGYFAWLLLLAALLHQQSPLSTWQRFVRAQLGPLARLPKPLALGLPAMALGLAWAAAHPWMVEAGLVAPPRSTAHLVQQAVVVGLGAGLVWEPLVVGLLILHLLDSYVYLGSHPGLAGLSRIAARLLQSLRRLPLQVGRLDLTPLVGLAAALAAFGLWRAALIRLFHRLPL